MPCWDTSEHRQNCEVKACVAHTYCSYQVPLKGTRDWGDPGLGTYACKTTWHERAGWRTRIRGRSSKCLFPLSLEWPPHPDGVHIINCPSRELEKMNEGGFVSPCWAYTGHSSLSFGVLPRCHVGSSDWPWPESYAVTLFAACAFNCYHAPKLPASF